MGEFASKGVAGTGLGLGIAGTALGVLAGSNGGNGGLLGGLFGNGCADKVSALMSENAMLKSENYSDKVAKDVYGQSLTDNRRLRDEMYAFIKPLSDEAASNRERVAVLEAQVAKDGEIGKLREELVRSQLGARIDECCCKTTPRSMLWPLPRLAVSLRTLLRSRPCRTSCPVSRAPSSLARPSAPRSWSGGTLG